ncbi:hypothetical protein DFH09DRAFT_548813 [Mycena vulgaris]|nr:hypothetical protein DFH09DRAFT_548813 [Mycena vulgaris]
MSRPSRSCALLLLTSSRSCPSCEAGGVCSGDLDASGHAPSVRYPLTKALLFPFLFSVHPSSRARQPPPHAASGP